MSKAQADKLAALQRAGWRRIPSPPGVPIGGSVLLTDPEGNRYRLMPDGSTVREG